MEDDKLYTILQVCDSAFPIGGFSHSMGVEAAIQNFYIEDLDSLKLFLLCSLENTGSFCIPFIRAAHEASEDLQKVLLLDSMHDASLLNHVAHRASKQQGKSFLITSYDVFKLHQLEALKDFSDEQKIHCHFPIIFAVVCAFLDIPAFKVGKMYLFSSLRTLIGSIVRLGKIGAVQAQVLQFQMERRLDEILLRYWKLEPDESYIAFPMVEVLQNSHDTMFSKLFFS